MEHKVIESDVLIIGGGTAGCYAGIRLAEESELNIVIVDKADIRRSGCLAAGVNALNAYITDGHIPEDYVEYASKDAEGIVRGDLLLDLARRLNKVTHDMEKRGLTILKDENGKYVSRGWRNLKINGENIKPILAAEVRKQKNITVYEHVNVTDLIKQDDAVTGATGFGITDGNFYEFRAGAVLVATGGAAGIYKPNDPQGAAHQMWYCPFNTGAGYAMGILAGAEMTTFEMRFIALRCKDTIAPTGTIAQGVGAKQINSKGEIYEDKYGLTTSQRLWGTVTENREGRGPCYLKTSGVDEKTKNDLYKAYLNMAPLQTLKWLENGGPERNDVEIEGTEPYIVGGHTASGYWVGRDRSTTVKGLFAAGDVAGGAPQKYVTGSLAEGEIAAEGVIDYLKDRITDGSGRDYSKTKETVLQKKAEYESFLEKGKESANSITGYTPKDLETAMQKVMDEYAGGIRTDYRYTSEGLKRADKRLRELTDMLPGAKITDVYDLLSLYEVRERLIVARVLTAHLEARKETRWHSFQENALYPEKSPEYECYINSVLEDGEVRIIRRDLIREEA